MNDNQTDIFKEEQIQKNNRRFNTANKSQSKKSQTIVSIYGKSFKYQIDRITKDNANDPLFPKRSKVKNYSTIVSARNSKNNLTRCIEIFYRNRAN